MINTIEAWNQSACTRNKFSLWGRRWRYSSECLLLKQYQEHAIWQICFEQNLLRMEMALKLPPHPPPPPKKKKILSDLTLNRFMCGKYHSWSDFFSETSVTLWLLTFNCSSFQCSFKCLQHQGVCVKIGRTMDVSAGQHLYFLCLLLLQFTVKWTIVFQVAKR